jgi:hypothetical protein
MPSSSEIYLERIWEWISGGAHVISSGGGGGGGGAATIADGADVTKGSKTDARDSHTDATPITEMQVLKEISYMEQNPASQAVTGTFYPVTQPISAASGQFVAGSIADGANVVEGTKADVPVDVVEDITARTGISLWKGIKNYLKSILAILGATNGAAVITDADGTVQQYLRGLVKLIVAKITVILDATENHIGIVSGQGSAVSAEITRPGGATPYAVNDVIGYTAGAALIPFANIARVNGGTGYIVKARLMTSQKTNLASYRLHIYMDNTPTPIADNALFTLLWANRAVRVGYIDLQNMQTEDPTGSDCAVAFTGDIRLHFQTAAASRNLYGVLETKSIFTPDAAQVFFIELETELD